MSELRKFVIYKFGIAVAIVALFSAIAFAQEVDEELATEELATEEPASEVSVDESVAIEEIIVVEPKPGSRRRVDREYEDPVRAKLLKDFYKMQEFEEEYKWRTSSTEYRDSRIEWGYDPRDDYRMRNEMALQELPSERNKPATLFRFKFE